ncbi:Zn(2)-C6 fungal-type domain-containing protein, partial [Rhodotorula toruloides]
PLEHEIAVARAQCGVPLQTTIVKHLVQVAAWGFDPVETELGASDIVDEGSFRSELEKLTGIPAQTLLDHLEILGPDQPDLVPFRDVLIAGIRSINPHPSSLPAFWRTIISIRQLQGILLFTAATEWLEARQKAGEPIVDPTHELWWKLLNHRVCLAFALPPEFVPGQVEYGKRCFETARAWMQRGMDLDDPDLAEVFSTEPVAYSIVSPYLWPSKAADATLAPPAAAKKTKKVTSGSANVKLKLPGVQQHHQRDSPIPVSVDPHQLADPYAAIAAAQMDQRGQQGAAMNAGGSPLVGAGGAGAVRPSPTVGAGSGFGNAAKGATADIGGASTARKRTADDLASGGGSTRAGGRGNGGAAEKKKRSKAACASCKSVKQKCEGPPYVPCRRCELYKLECKFPPGTKTIPRPPDSPAAETSSSEPAVLSRMEKLLFEMTTRMRTVESALHINPSANAADDDSVDAFPHRDRSPSPHSSEDGNDTDDNASVTRHLAASANPLHEINATIDSIQGAPAPRMSVMEMSDYGSPDVLRRGVLNPDECQQLFDFFFASLHPWVMMLSLDEDRNAMAVRTKSPLLFHTILLLATAYSSPFPQQLHLTLVTFLNAILAPQLLNPQPHELTTDFLRAIDLLNLYKPTQFGARRLEGLDDKDAMRHSKLNGLASWMLQGILARTAERLDLKDVVSKFSRAYSASASGQPIPKDLLRDLRLYYWLLSNDVHGNVQSGRRCNMEGAQALTTTRLFSSLALQPFDVRLAASVEMFEVARPILRSYSYERTRRIPKPDLERYNQGMRSFDDTWIPALIRQLGVDPLAMTVISPFREFITLQFHVTCYTSWKSTRMYASSDGSSSEGRPSSSSDNRPKRMRTDGPRSLNDWEYEGIQRLVKSAEFLLFSLSEESRVVGQWRKVQWEEAERSDGWRKLILDDQMVEQSKWGMDAITCVAYAFPMTFLTKLIGEGLMTANLVVNRTPTPQPPWLYTQKLPRLLELGAAFLDAVATNDLHPSRAQANVVRMLLETGVKGRLPSPTANNAPISLAGAAASFAPGQAQQQRVQQAPAAYPPAAPPSWSTSQPPPPGQVYGAGAGIYATVPPNSNPTPPTASAVPMDDALGLVLNDFEPLFGESWQWGFGPSSAGPQTMPTPQTSRLTPAALGQPGSDVDWSAVSALTNPLAPPPN